MSEYSKQLVGSFDVIEQVEEVLSLDYIGVRYAKKGSMVLFRKGKEALRKMQRQAALKILELAELDAAVTQQIREHGGIDNLARRKAK